MTNLILISALWLIGFFLSYWMLKVEHEAENEVYTKGQKALQVVLSIFSFVFVFYILISAWVRSVSAYWKQPLKQNKPE